MPLYLGICFLFHPLIGWAATVGGLLLIAITIATEYLSRKPARDAVGVADRRMALAEASRRNAEVVQAMGMGGRLSRLWNDHNQRHVAAQQRVADIAGGMSALSRILRMILQSAVLAVGAWLVINQQATAGIIIASSILTSRALAPVEVAIAHWRGFIAARQSWRRLNGLLAAIPAERPRMELPTPKATLTLEAVGIDPPGTNRIVAQGIAFQLKAGQGLGVIGPSASGKSSLVRALVGVWPAIRGKVRLDGAALDQWSAEALGPHIGYLPQDMELFDGTVAENIARFASDASLGGGDRRGQGSERPRADPGAAQRLRDPGRRRRQCPVGRPAPAHRARPRALRRSLPGRARRAQFQPRPRRRRGADQGHPRRSRARRHRRRRRPPADAPWPASTRCWSCRRAASRPSDQGAGAPAAAAGAGTSRHRPRACARRWRFTPAAVHRSTHLDQSSTLCGAICCSASPPCSCLPASRLGWGAWTEISGAVIAPGKLVVDSNVKKVQHPTGGVVGELRRQGRRPREEGRHRGAARRDAGPRQLRHRHQGARRDGGAPGPARGRARRRRQGHLSRPTCSARAQRARRGAGDDERAAPVRAAPLGARGPEGAAPASRSTSSASRSSATTSRWRRRPRRSTGTSRSWAASASLWKQNLVPFNRVTTLERDSARLDGERGALIASIAQAKGRIAEIQLKILQIDEDLRTEVGKELAEIRGKRSELTERRVAAEDQLKRIDLRAPQDGRVLQQAVHTVGGVIQAGEVLMLVVPDADELIIEAKVAPQDIDQIHVGQHAVVQFAAFNRRTTPELNGEVIGIGADITQDDKRNEPSTPCASASPTRRWRGSTGCSRWPACRSKSSSRPRRARWCPT